MMMQPVFSFSKIPFCCSKKSKQKKDSKFNSLSLRIHVAIFLYLPFEELPKLTTVSSNFKNAIDSHPTTDLKKWREKFLARIPQEVRNSLLMKGISLTALPIFFKDPSRYYDLLAQSNTVVRNANQKIEIIWLEKSDWFDKTIERKPLYQVVKSKKLIYADKVVRTKTDREATTLCFWSSEGRVSTMTFDDYNHVETNYHYNFFPENGVMLALDRRFLKSPDSCTIL